MQKNKSDLNTMQTWIPKYPLWYFWSKSNVNPHSCWCLEKTDGIVNARQKWDLLKLQEFKLSERP